MSKSNLTTHTEAGFATRSIHHAYDPLSNHGSLTPPVYLTSTFAFPDAQTGARRFAGEEPGFVYSRVGNPTTDLLEKRMANLEGSEAALATSSGMGAIASTIWSIVGTGEEIVADQTLYGCTFSLFHDQMPRFGVRIAFVDMTDLRALDDVLSVSTKIVFLETPANPNMRVIDISAVSERAHRVGATVVVDSTYATPFLQQPLRHGADIVLHSATKYLGGHGDLLGGMVCGSRKLIDNVRLIGVKEMTGAVMSAFDAFLVLRGLKTLQLRMNRHCTSAAHVALFLAENALNVTVHYPTLKSHEQRAVAASQMSQGGGIVALTFESGWDAATAFMNRLQLFTKAVSLGDAESLVQHPASMTHSSLDKAEQLSHGIDEGLVRLSIGLEDETDILADLKQAITGSPSAATSFAHR